MPNWTFTVFGFTAELNPGPFNVKEHVIITIMTAAGSGPSYAIDILLAQEVFYQQAFKSVSLFPCSSVVTRPLTTTCRWGFQIMLILSTQAMGFGLAGVMRRFLVWPAAMVWPATLITTTVMFSLHDHSPSDAATTNGWKIGRYKFFLIVALCTFCYEWIPQIMAQFLQYFLFVCWIAPNNVIVNQLFGGQSGLGIIPISFDWNTVSGFLGSPLQTPAFAIFNVAAGTVLMMVGCIGLSYAGPEFYRYLPISTNHNYDRFGNIYNTTKVLNSDFTFNHTKYENYSPLFLGPAFSLTYGMAFATLISTVVHVAMFYGRDIWSRARSTKFEQQDVHLRLMRKYREAPEWVSSRPPKALLPVA